MRALSGFAVRHKAYVVVFWLVATIAGAIASSGLGSRLSQQASVPGSAGYQADQRILQRYGNGGAGYPEVVVIVLPVGEDAAREPARAETDQAFTAVAGLPGVRVVDYASTGDRAFLTTDPRTTYGLVSIPYEGEGTPSMEPQIINAMRPVLPAGSVVRVTGMNELKSGGHAKESLGVLAETLTAGSAALIVLLVVFGSALAVVPLLMAWVAIPVTFLTIYGLTEITDVFFVVQYLVALIGLGLAIDYSLLLVTRWREELAAGYNAEQAVHRAMATAGRSIAFSGVTVALGLGCLIVLPVPLVRSIGLGGILIPAVSVAVTLTLLPVLLAAVGRRMDVPRRDRSPLAGRAWIAWTQLVVRRRWTAAVAGLAVLGAAEQVYLTRRDPPGPHALP